MNNQRRHQLEQNVLAGYMGNSLSKLQPLLKPLALAAILGGVVFVAYGIYQTFASKNTSRAWTDYYFNLDGDAESFNDLADQNAKSSAGQWARFSAAASYLQEGIDALFVNRQEGVTSIRKAIDILEKLKGSSIDELQIQVLHSLAKAHESLGELPEAIGYYENLAGLQKLSEAERNQASDRLAYLKTDDAKDFYRWFERLDPKPASPPPLPTDLSVPPAEPSITFDPGNLPDLPAQGDVPTTNPDAPSDSNAPAEAPLEVDQPPVEATETDASSSEESLPVDP